MQPKNPIKQLLLEQNISFKEMSDKETKSFFNNWISKNLVTLNQKTKVNIIARKIYWHVFSFNLISHYKNEDADSKFQELYGFKRF